MRCGARQTMALGSPTPLGVLAATTSLVPVSGAAVNVWGVFSATEMRGSDATADSIWAAILPMLGIWTRAGIGTVMRGARTVFDAPCSSPLTGFARMAGNGPLAL